MVMQADTVDNAWYSYARNVIPNDAPEVQYTECRRAFHAGAWAVLQVVIGIGEDSSVSEADGCAILDRLERELKEFYRRVKEGKA